MADVQTPVTEKTEASIAEQKAADVAPAAETVVPEEKKTETTPAQPVENTEAAQLPAEPVVTAEPNSEPVAVVQEKVEAPAQEPEVVAPVKEEPATSEVKPETPIEQKVDEATNANEIKQEAEKEVVQQEAVVEKEVVQQEPVAEKQDTPATAVEKIDEPVEAQPAQIVVEKAEVVQQPAETKAAETQQDQEPKKTDGPDKTSVTLPPDGSAKNNEETEAYLRENMPEGHTYEKIWKIFYAFDHDLNGTIAMCELADALRCCGLYVSQKEVHRLKLTLELEHNRVINFGQFCKFLVIRKKDSVERLTKAFMRFDKNRTGYIDTIELRRCLTTMGEALTKTQVDDMLKGLDVDADGKVEFQEFVDYMLSEQQL